jgi:hypothetical protein
MDALKRFCLIAVMVSPAAHATLVTINASDFAAGATISAPGFTIQGVFGPTFNPTDPTISYSELVSGTTTSPELAPHIFRGMLPSGSSAGGWQDIATGSYCHDAIIAGTALAGGTCFRESWSFVEISFATPTTFVEAVGGFGHSLGGHIFAFDASGSMISCASVVCAGYNTYGVGQYGSTMIAATPMISSIRFGAAQLAGFIAMSSFTFDDGISVPEPGTLALFGVGLLLPLLIRRRRAHAPG